MRRYDVDSRAVKKLFGYSFALPQALAMLDGGDTATDRERRWGETLDQLQAALGAR